MISIFTTISNPQKRGDCWKEAIKCYSDFADEVIVVSGGKENWLDIEAIGKNVKCIFYEWPEEFSWEFIGEQFHRGYEACSGDWVIHMDVDFFFHERDFGRIKQALKDYPSSPAVSFYKWQFILPDRYNLKSRLVLAVNKGAFGDRLRFNGGGDLCQPTLDNVNLNLDEVPQSGVPFYNYEKIKKKVPQIADDVGRMDRAYYAHFGKYLYGEGDDMSAFDGWIHMSTGRLGKPQQFIGFGDHPKYIQKVIKNLKPDQWGYGGFGLTEENRYVKSMRNSR